MIEIIVVTYNTPNDMKECVSNILYNTEIPYNLRVYDNFEKDIPLSKCWNYLIGKSDADIVVVMNADTIPMKGWLEELVKPLENKDVGIVGPVSNKASGEQGGYAKAGEGEPFKKNIISGFCFAVRKEVWKELGGFDEELQFYHGDTEFSLRSLEAGYRNVAVPKSFVYHQNCSSYGEAEKRNKDLRAIIDNDQQLFKKKYGYLKRKYA